MSEYFKLDENNNPVPCTLTEWGELYETKEGNKKRPAVFDEVEGYELSTVFLGIDHEFGSKTPVLCETMIFGKGKGEGYQTRCRTWDEALEMAKKLAQETMPPHEIQSKVRELLNCPLKQKNERTLPIGVDINKGRYRARIRNSGEKIHLGYFDCPNKAHQAYLKAKQELKSQ